MTARFISGPSRLILGDSKPQRLRIQQTLLASAAYSSFMVLHLFEVRYGLMNAAPSDWLAAFCLTGMVGFYLLIRSGLNLRLSQDPTLTVPQQVFATFAAVWTYAIGGHDRGAMIGIILLILVFGAFRANPRDTKRLSVMSLLMLGGVMIWQCGRDSAKYPVDIAAFHFLYTILAVWPIYILTAWHARMRDEVKSQKSALEDALDQIRRLAENDDLTGLINRRAMLQRLQSEITMFETSDAPMCIALIDIDRFKTVNDKFGHHKGDETLRRFAQVCKANLRANDLLARWGGEEFLLMLPGTPLEQGIDCLDRLREALAATSFDCVSPGFQITISAGLTDLHETDALEAAILRADQAMYRAKQMGRDKIIGTASTGGIASALQNNLAAPAQSSAG